MSLLLAAALLAAAPPPSIPSPPVSDQGPVTRADLEALNKMRFDEMDANKDGALTLAELNIALGSKRGSMALQGLDGDSDGKVTLPELSKQMLVMFELTDADHDGVVTPQERAALRDAVHKAKPSGSAQ